MGFNLKKQHIITILDIALILFVMIFAKTYLVKYNKNSTSITKDGVKYTMVINSQKVKKDEILNIRFKIENKKKKIKRLEIKKNVPFNYVIQKNGDFLYKRDLLESLAKKPKFITLGKYGKTEFGSEWYGDNVLEKELPIGRYTIIAYSTDLDIELILDFEIIEEGK